MNRLRVAILSLLVLACIAGALPLTATLAKWSRSAAIKHHRRHRHHSRAWWRRHRALARSRRERAERLRPRLAPPSQAGAETLTSRMSAAVNTSLLSFNNTTSGGAAAVVPASMA